MAVRAGTGMMKTSPHGMNDGYVLIDALAGLFIVALLTSAVLAGTGIALRQAAKQRVRTTEEIRSRSDRVERDLSSGSY